MASDRFIRIGRTLLRCAWWFVAFIGFVYLCNYVADARMRMARAPACEWDTVPNPDNKPYSARWCKLTKDSVLLRLYDAEDRQLLAERTFFNLDRPRPSWGPNRLWCDTDDSFIALPPPLVERLLAKLP